MESPFLSFFFLTSFLEHNCFAMVGKPISEVGLTLGMGELPRDGPAGTAPHPFTGAVWPPLPASGPWVAQEGVDGGSWPDCTSTAPGGVNTWQSTLSVRVTG